jgi:hypothetical protein
VGPRGGLDAEARRKILCPCWGSNPDRPARSQTLHWLSDRMTYVTLASHIVLHPHAPEEEKRAAFMRKYRVNSIDSFCTT